MARLIAPAGRSRRETVTNCRPLWDERGCAPAAPAGFLAGLRSRRKTTRDHHSPPESLPGHLKDARPGRAQAMMGALPWRSYNARRRLPKARFAQMFGSDFSAG